MADVVEILQRAGGAVRYADLAALTSGRSIRRALEGDEITRVAKGVYALPSEPSDLTVAIANGGVLSRQSAAIHHGLEVVTRPLVPHVTISRTQRRRATELACVLHRSESPAVGNATTPLQTVLECARYLPFGEALAIADSALRLKKVEPAALTEAASACRGPGRAGVLRVAAAADKRAESALESMLRARVLGAGFTGFVPQYRIRDRSFYARVDLADPTLRIVLEADSFAHHGTRQALRKDCRRYVELAIRGWILLRYSWEDVILDEPWVGTSLNALIARPTPPAATTQLAA
jgi:very-short-patch-repair endonuclease